MPLRKALCLGRFAPVNSKEAMQAAAGHCTAAGMLPARPEENRRPQQVCGGIPAAASNLQCKEIFAILRFEGGKTRRTGVKFFDYTGMQVKIYRIFAPAAGDDTPLLFSFRPGFLRLFYGRNCRGI